MELVESSQQGDLFGPEAADGGLSVAKLPLEFVELGPPAGVHEYGFLAAFNGFDECIEHMFDSMGRV